MNTLRKKLNHFRLVLPVLAMILLQSGCSAESKSADLRDQAILAGGTSNSSSTADTQESQGTSPQTVSGTNFTRLLSYTFADFECTLDGGNHQSCRAVNHLAGGVIERDLSGFSDVRALTWYIGQEQNGGTACQVAKDGLELRCNGGTIPDQKKVRLQVTHLDGSRRTIGTESAAEVVADLSRKIEAGSAYALFLAGPTAGTATVIGDTRDMMNQACEDAGAELIKGGPLAAAKINRFKALVGAKADDDGKISGFKSDWPVMTLISPIADNGASGVLVPVASSLKSFWVPTPGTILNNGVQYLADGTTVPVGSVVWTGQSVQSDGTVVRGKSCGGWSNANGAAGAPASETFANIGVIGEFSGARWLSSGQVQECSSTQAMVYCVAYRKIEVQNVANNGN